MPKRIARATASPANAARHDTSAAPELAARKRARRRRSVISAMAPSRRGARDDVSASVPMRR
jgi:hypothetical protein